MTRAPLRPRWHERQVLESDDLRIEQGYRLGLAHRHEAIAHTWGIVSGLALEPCDDGLVLGAGLAVDAYGHELVVPADYFVPWAVIEGSPPQRLDAWLLWCPVAEQGSGGRGAGRVTEEARLRLTVAGPDPVVPPWTPPGRSDADVDAPAALGPDGAWPVYLGRLERADDGGSRRYALPAGGQREAVARPFAGLRGSRVDAVSGIVQLRLDESPLAAHAAVLAARGQDGVLADRLAIDPEGRTTVDGNVGAGGDVHLATVEPPASADGRNNPALRMGAGTEAPPMTAAPWRVYRCTDPDDGGHRDLRIELEHPAGKDDPGRYRFTIGGRGDGGAFRPCLAVTADCTVHVLGDLHTCGAPIVEGPVRDDPTDPALFDVLTSQWLQGLKDASQRVDLTFPAPSVAGDALTVSLAGRPNRQATEGQDFGHRVEVRNTTAAPVSQIRITTTGWLDQTPLGARSLAEVPTLAPGAVQARDDSIRVPDHSAGRTLTVSCVAVGLTASGAIAFAATTALWAVVAASPEEPR